MRRRCVASSVIHWFSVRGTPGLRLPYCNRGCGTANPKWNDNRCADVCHGDPCGLTQLEHDRHKDTVAHAFERIQRPSKGEVRS